nr:hypothetical protein BaRGS_026589 [Batillaria attramentaria]
MSAEIGQLRLTVAALSAKLGEPRERPATVKTSKQPKAGGRCYWCDQAGHFERACPAKQNYRRRKRPRRRRQQRFKLNRDKCVFEKEEVSSSGT